MTYKTFKTYKNLSEQKPKTGASERLCIWCRYSIQKIGFIDFLPTYYFEQNIRNSVQAIAAPVGLLRYP